MSDDEFDRLVLEHFPALISDQYRIAFSDGSKTLDDRRKAMYTSVELLMAT